MSNGVSVRSGLGSCVLRSWACRGGRMSLRVDAGGRDVIVVGAGLDRRCCRGRSCGDRPSGRGGAQAEHGEAGQVDGGGEEVEVGVDFGSAADTGSASAVAATHQVAELAFDLGSGGPVVGLPVGIALAGAGLGERSFVPIDADRAPSGGVGALGAQRTVRAVLGEVGDAAAVGAAPDRHGDAVGAGDGVGVEINVEAVLGEQAAGRRRWLGPTARGDVFIVEVLLELAGAVGRVAVDLRPVARRRRGDRR